VRKFLKVFSIVLVLIVSIPLIYVLAEDKAQLANDNPFYNGELNIRYEGEKTALAGKIIKIERTNGGRELYQLNLRINGINHIWVTGVAPFAKGDVNLGDELIFRGFIASADGLDESGQLKVIINSHTLLLALKAELPNLT